jgi:hypothetical protein
MNEEGTRYSTVIRRSACMIDQTAQGDFELFVGGLSKGRFETASKAREKIISVICDETGVDVRLAWAEVPLLSDWTKQATAPFNPELG